MKLSIEQLAELISEDPNATFGATDGNMLANNLQSSTEASLLQQQKLRNDQQRKSQQDAQRQLQPQFDAAEETIDNVDDGLDGVQQSTENQLMQQTNEFGSLDAEISDLKNLLQNVRTVQPQI